ncbi:MAG: hypothetical protein MI685_12205 [Chlorobiales bacterium]|nr:hypothetical protein [Chlorobiales bacterium]
MAARGHFDKEALALLRSRDFLEDFVREKDILYLIFPRRWDRINDQWAVKASQVPNLQEGADLLQKQLISKRKKRAGLLYIGIDYSDPHAAAAIVNRVLMYLNERIKEEALEKAARRDAYYERKLFRHDSLLVHRLDSLVAMLPDMPAGAVLGNAGDSSVDDAMLKKFLKAISLKEREKLVAEKQSNNNIIMRANLAAEEFAFKAYEEARAPKERIWPKTPFIFAMAIATGIFSGFLIAFIKEVAVQPVRDGS